MSRQIPGRHGTKEICELLHISPRQLEYWVLIGVVKPILEPHGTKTFKKFSDDDVHFLRKVKALTDEGVLVSKAAQHVRDQNFNWVIKHSEKIT